MRGIILGIVRDVEVTRDICQDAILIAYRSLATLQDHGKFASWLCSIARYQSYQFVRHRRRQRIKERLSHEPELIEDIHSISDPAETLDHNETVRRLHHVVLRMRPEYREVVELRYWRSMSIKEIAHFLGLPASTVKWRLYKGKEAIRSLINKTCTGVIL